MTCVLVTGANRGLGLEFTRQYAAAGWKVYAACRRPREAAELAEIAQGGRVSVLELDVSEPRTIARAARAVTDPIEVLINGAGIMGESAALGRTDYEAWQEVLRVNTLGPVRVSAAFATHVARSARKVIVTITSRLGSIADNTSGGWIAYRSSKAAVNMAMRNVAIELAGQGVTCVVLSPGWVRTDMGGPGAPLSPSESVAAMRRLIERLGPGDSGKFFHYDGKSLPW